MTDLIQRIEAAKEPSLPEQHKAMMKLSNWWVGEWLKHIRRPPQPCASRSDFESERI